ncbi:MAG: DUF2924 domain-containing protein [Lentisphaeria bacterium]|nr:MAG: DUF2924 domain-containing protein [Lentisphaeria bacterium]
MEQMKKAIKNVESMEIQPLRAEFHRLYGDIPHPMNTRTLKNRIIYRIQEMYLGGLSEVDKKLLAQFVSPKKISLPTQKGGIAPAIHYIREWKGKTYDVTVISDKCFECEGKRYKSLSAVAREITGTRWNGKVFFRSKEMIAEKTKNTLCDLYTKICR